MQALPASAGAGGCAIVLLNGLAGNVGDIATTDAEVVQFAVAHAAEFIAGLAILAPVIERASEVHDPDPFEVILPALVLAGLHLMVELYAAVPKNTETMLHRTHAAIASLGVQPFILF